MTRPKYKKGRKFESTYSAVQWILSGGHVYMRHKFYSWKWAIHWPLNQIMRLVRNEVLFPAKRREGEKPCS